MKITSIRLRGFIGLKKGLGLDEVCLDLSGLSGLIALSGPNGHGKTTLLDNMHPFPCLGSRDKALSHHVFLRDSFRDLYFDHEGRTYRTLIKIDSESDKTEGFIWVDGQSIVEGKITDYKKKIQEIFGSQTLFFNSVFCAQNAPKLSGIRTGLLRDLFAEFLRLDELQEKHETAKQCSNIMQGKVTDKSLALEKLSLRLRDLASIPERIGLIESEIEAQKGELNHNVNNIKQLELAMEELTELRQKDELKKVEIKAVETELSSKEQRCLEETKRLNVYLDELRGKAKSLRAEIAEASEILKDKDSILKAGDKAKEIKESLDVLLIKIIASRDALTALQFSESETQSSLSTFEKALLKNNSNPQVAELEAEIFQLQSLTKDLDKKDPSCDSTTCAFISSALEATKKIPQRREALRALKNDIELDSKGIINSINTTSTTIEYLKKAISINKEKLILLENKEASADKEIRSTQILLAKKTALESSEAIIKSKETDFNANIAEGLKVKSELENVESSYNAEKIVLQDKISFLQSELEHISTSDIQEGKERITAKRADLDRFRDDLRKKEAELITLQEQAKGIKKIEKEKAELTQEADALKKEVEEWAWLSSALSKTRLQALEIAGAAPTIAGYANNLLSSAFGPQTMVNLQTQDENGKEILRIIVIDEDGKEVELSMRSGGQQVWALKALRLAMAMLSKEKSCKNFQTILTDEEDGALDSEKAVKFIHLYRAFMEHGGFDSCFYISHKPECVDMADHVLEFSAGGIEIV